MDEVIIPRMEQVMEDMLSESSVPITAMMKLLEKKASEIGQM